LFGQDPVLRTADYEANDAEPTLAARYRDPEHPTVAVFRDGEPVSAFVGAYTPAAIGKFLDDLLAKETEAAAA
jgi:thioredoxin-like negative regulator of GroEL